MGAANTVPRSQLFIEYRVNENGQYIVDYRALDGKCFSNMPMTELSLKNLATKLRIQPKRVYKRLYSKEEESANRELSVSLLGALHKKTKNEQ